MRAEDSPEDVFPGSKPVLGMGSRTCSLAAVGTEIDSMVCPARKIRHGPGGDGWLLDRHLATHTRRRRNAQRISRRGDLQATGLCLPARTRGGDRPHVAAAESLLRAISFSFRFFDGPFQKAGLSGSQVPLLWGMTLDDPSWDSERGRGCYHLGGTIFHSLGLTIMLGHLLNFP